MKTKRWMALLLTLVLAMACTCALAEATTYTVTFNTNTPEGVTVTDPPAQTVKSGNTVVQPSAPAAAGYRFEGWYSDADLTARYDFTDKVTKDITLYAKWTPITYTVTFNLQDSSLAAINPVTDVTHGATVAAPDPAPSKTGYTFGGWYKEPTCATEFKFTGEADADTVTSNITLYAKWSIKQYQVTFDNQGHGIQPHQQSVNHGDTAKNRGDLVEQGYRFEGWYTDLNDPNTKYTFTEQVTSDVTLHAKWTTLRTVSFNMNGHGAVIKPVTVDDGGTVSAPDPAPTAEGYEFGGWYTDAACTGNAVTFNETISNDTTYYAKWTATVKVTFQWKTAITNSGGAPSDSATVALVVNGKEQNDLQTVGPDSVATWTNLPASDVYSVVAKNVPDNYTAVVTRTAENSYLVTYVEDDKLTVTPIINKHEPDKIDMVISKFWDDNNSQHRPAEIKVQVKKKNVDGTLENVGAPITLNAGNQWTAHVTDLYMRESGQTIQYTIEEVSQVMGYTTTCEITVDAQGNYTVKVTNVLTGKVDIVGTKEWHDDNDRDGIRPDSVQLKIYENAIADANLVKIVIVTAGDSTGNVWNWSVEDLPVYDKFGRPITYIVVEDPVPEGYTASAPQYVTVGTPNGDPTN